MSQLYADKWALGQFPNGGFFLDIGCGDGEYISNTFELEKNGWKGICIDAFPKNFDSRPNSIVVQACVGPESGKKIEFLVSDTWPELSGILEDNTTYKEQILSGEHRIVDVYTHTIRDILETHKAPRFIEYVNLDIEGSEVSILKTFPFDTYKFGLFSIEFNNNVEIGDEINNIMEQNGYFCCDRIAWDIWFASKSMNPPINIDILKNIIEELRIKLNST